MIASIIAGSGFATMHYVGSLVDSIYFENPRRAACAATRFALLAICSRSNVIVRQGDDNWVDVANWTLSALLFAEQEGITSKNVDEIKAKPTSPQVSKFLGVTPGMGTGLGLSDDWAYTVIKKMGNYAEIFDRNLGAESPYKMERELTNLWNNGGVLFPLVID